MSNETLLFYSVPVLSNYYNKDQDLEYPIDL